LEVLPRRSCLIDCAAFNGATVPAEDASVDTCMFVDVLHHTLNIAQLLMEARRVTRRYVLIKDHLCEDRFDRGVLTFMDWVGNRPHEVALPFNYQSKAEWDRLFSSCRLEVVHWNQNLPLYPPLFNNFFGRGLHFLAVLERA